jgi:hypothetical protein
VPTPVPVAAEQRRPSAPASRWPAAAPAPAVAERPCRYCRSELAPEARKCAACGEWAVGTSTGFTAALLRLLAWCWAGGSALAAAGLWYGGSAMRAWVVARAVDPVVAPLVLDVLVYGLAAFVLLQGVTVGVGLTVLANLSPRRPRWWS